MMKGPKQLRVKHRSQARRKYGDPEIDFFEKKNFTSKNEQKVTIMKSTLPESRLHAQLFRSFNHRESYLVANLLI